MQITAEERGRRLILTVGGREPGMNDLEASEADEDVIRISVPPVSAEVGSQLFAFYTGITFARQDTLDRIHFTGTMKQAVEYMTKLALGAVEFPDDQGGSEQQRIIARQRWNAVQSLRWEEGRKVCESALFWNVQGGGLQAVSAVLDGRVDEQGNPLGGTPKASELLLKQAGLWDAYTQLTMLLNSESGSRIPGPADTPDTPTPSGTKPSDEASPESAPDASTPPSEQPTAKTYSPRARSSRTPSSSGGSRSRSGTASPRSTSTSTTGGTKKPPARGQTARGSGSTPGSSD